MTKMEKQIHNAYDVAVKECNKRFQDNWRLWAKNDPERHEILCCRLEESLRGAKCAHEAALAVMNKL